MKHIFSFVKFIIKAANNVRCGKEIGHGNVPMTDYPSKNTCNIYILRVNKIVINDPAGNKWAQTGHKNVIRVRILPPTA